MTPRGFAQAMAAFGPPTGVVAVAVSGGPHSLALALLANAWAAPLGITLLALVAEHGLRAESAAEAADVAAMLTGQGIVTAVLPLGLAKGAGMQERARAARLGALLAACQAAGALWLLLGHHRMDQAETLLLRAGRGAGEAGLAGMPTLRSTAEALILRPLLGAPPAALEAVCAAAGLAPVRDPSNDNPAFARIRARQALADSGGQGARVAALAAATRAFGRRRVEAEEELLARLGAAVELRPDGAARLDRAALGADSTAAALLGRLLRAVGGAIHAPAQAEVQHLLAVGQGTLSGAWWRADGWLIREPALVARPIPAKAGAIWDGRFHLAESQFGCVLGALGCQPAGASRLPAALRAGLPALWRDGELLAAPHICIGRALPCLEFRPIGGPVGSVFGSNPQLGHSPQRNTTYVM